MYFLLLMIVIIISSFAIIKKFKNKKFMIVYNYTHNIGYNCYIKNDKKVICLSASCDNFIKSFSLAKKEFYLSSRGMLRFHFRLVKVNENPGIICYKVCDKYLYLCKNGLMDMFNKVPKNIYIRLCK